MPTSSQTPVERKTVEELAIELLTTGKSMTHGETDARRLLDELRKKWLHQAIEAARGEYLQDNTGTPEDEAYNQAVSDVVAAIGALLEGGAR